MIQGCLDQGLIQSFKIKRKKELFQNFSMPLKIVEKLPNKTKLFQMLFGEQIVPGVV